MTLRRLAPRAHWGPRPQALAQVDQASIAWRGGRAGRHTGPKRGAGSALGPRSNLPLVRITGLSHRLPVVRRDAGKLGRRFVLGALRFVLHLNIHPKGR